MPVPVEPSRLIPYLERLSTTLDRRNNLVQDMVNKLKVFDGQPLNFEILPNYSVQDAEAVKSILERCGFRVELRMVANGNPYFRFYQGE